MISEDRSIPFNVFSPVNPSPKLPAGPGAVAGPRGHGEKIMVVDDEISLRLVTELILRKYGYDVVVAADGAEAVMTYAMQAPQIALVLTDLCMPYMDGVALTGALRKLNPKVRIVAFTGEEKEVCLEKLKAYGVKDFLNKPFSTSSLLEAVHGALATQEVVLNQV
jgi:two-component system cell cycle sensor histidine kinase/response regulator CckA